MNPEKQIELARILALDPNDVTEFDRAFLMARRGALTEEQRIKFDIPETPSLETQAEKPKKGSKTKTE